MVLANKCLYDMILENVRKFPDQTAIKFENQSHTWRSLKEAIDHTAEILLYQKVKKGTHVALWAVNSINWVITYFALGKIGAISVLINPNSQLHEMKTLLTYVDIEYLIIGDASKCVDPVLICKSLNEDSNFDCTAIREIYTIGKDCVAFRNLFEIDVPKEFKATIDPPDPQDILSILFTSGTTSTPKGVMLTHYNMVNNAIGISECMGIDHTDKFLVAVPLYHCFGVTGCILSCTHAGAEIDLLLYFKTEIVSETLLREQCTGLSGVPTMLIGLADYAEKHNLSYPNLHKGELAGSICAEKTFKRITKFLYEDIMVSYGQTEASPSITFSKPGDSIRVRATSVGCVMEDMELRIVDQHTKQTLAAGETGEICVRGYNVMKGYYKMPEVTAETIDSDGWLHTGDIGYLDETDYLHLIGRLKEMIIRGGENISPYEIEDVILELPDVSQVKVIGVADEKYQEEICACIILKEGATAEKEDILEHTRKSLAFFKQPKYILFMDQFPLTSSGKIQLPKLRSVAMDLLNKPDGPSCSIES
ncbi:MAG: AMP-binding protein [Anaerofustis sp.]